MLCQYLSSKHPNIKFTFEDENKNVLPFLDVNVYRDADKFSSTVHQRLFRASTQISSLSYLKHTKEPTRAYSI